MSGLDGDRNAVDNDETVATLPQKRFYRQRAHCNPWSDHTLSYPISPEHIDWTSHFPDFFTGIKPQVADLGCGYGGMLVTLSPMLPDLCMVGLEIRLKVSDYVQEKIRALREQNPGQYNNITCIRSNAMKFMPNYFEKAQLSKMFIMYPDPHFKRVKYKWRIVSQALLAEYAYVLKVGGHVYTVTDVEEVHNWMVDKFTAHPLFRRTTPEEDQSDFVVEKLACSTEEGQKVARNGGQVFPAVFIRIDEKID